LSTARTAQQHRSCVLCTAAFCVQHRAHRTASTAAAICVQHRAHHTASTTAAICVQHRAHRTASKFHLRSAPRAPHRSTAAAFCVQQRVPACAPCAHCEHCSCVPSVRTPRTRAHTDLLLLFATLVLLSLGPRTWGGGTFPINQNPRPERRSRKWVKKERGPFTTGS